MADLQRNFTRVQVFFQNGSAYIPQLKSSTFVLTVNNVLNDPDFGFSPISWSLLTDDLEVL